MLVSMSVDIQAPPEKVWPYLVEPEKATQWFTALKKVEGTYFLPDGTPDDKPLRVTYVWLRQTGRWKEVHHHGSQLVTGS